MFNAPKIDFLKNVMLLNYPCCTESQSAVPSDSMVNHQMGGKFS